MFICVVQATAVYNEFGELVGGHAYANKVEQERYRIDKERRLQVLHHRCNTCVADAIYMCCRCNIHVLHHILYMCCIIYCICNICVAYAMYVLHTYA